jgi:hypothetical protein
LKDGDLASYAFFGLHGAARTDNEQLMPSTKLVLITGEQAEVEGRVEDVGRVLQDAARSASGTLAWVKDARTGETLGVNPAHVVTVRPGDE